MEAQYKKILEKLNDQKTDVVDYLGINLDIDHEKNDLKLYYKMSYSMSFQHEIVDEFIRRGMIRMVSKVHDTVNTGCYRYDLGLDGRTNENMLDFLNDFSARCPAILDNREEIERMAGMPVSEDPDYRLAALYFFGFIEKEEEIRIAKFHYITRHLLEKDCIYRNIRYDDGYFLKYLEELQIPLLNQTAGVVRGILKNCGGHLWMTGADYALDGRKKYKIYIKECGDKLVEAMEALLPKLIGHDIDRWESRLRELSKWYGLHPELRCEGVAVCSSRPGRITLNFYNRFR